MINAKSAMASMTITVAAIASSEKNAVASIFLMRMESSDQPRTMVDERLEQLNDPDAHGPDNQARHDCQDGADQVIEQGIPAMHERGVVSFRVVQGCVQVAVANTHGDVTQEHLRY